MDTSNGTLENPLKGGAPGELIFLLSGKKTNLHNIESNPNIKSLSDIANPSISPMTISFKKDLNSNIVSNHAYTVISSDEKYTVIINPWDSSSELKIPTSFVLKNSNTLEYTDLGNDITKNTKDIVKSVTPKFL